MPASARLEMEHPTVFPVCRAGEQSGPSEARGTAARGFQQRIAILGETQLACCLWVWSSGANAIRASGDMRRRADGAEIRIQPAAWFAQVSCKLIAQERRRSSPQ